MHVPLYEHIGNGRWGHDRLRAERAIVDEADAELVAGHVWRLHSEGYAHTYVNSRVVLMHRLILGLTDGKIHTDHQNFNRLDNRRENIVAGTQTQNNRHIRKRKGTSSQFEGVSNFGHKWRAFIRGKHLGLFDSESEAAATAKEARQERGW